IKQHLNEIGGAWLASMIMFVVYALLSSAVGGVATFDAFLVFIVQLLIINVLAVFVMVVISYSVAFLTFSRGWNPDNFVIPIESSLADTMTTAAIIVALALIV
ncbi:MAG: magnesium transporter, partial [Candidatus Bathyarchaeota archaeon]|nr:magnesium transporter [Candidatus Bathyarchaeota archaeon]